jgi:hypothetical protein
MDDKSTEIPKEFKIVALKRHPLTIKYVGRGGNNLAQVI